MAAQDHADPWALMSSLFVEIDDYLERLERGMATIEVRKKLDDHPMGGARLYPSTFATAETLRAMTTRHQRYLLLVCGQKKFWP